MSERRPSGCEFLEHGLGSAARTFRRTSRSTSLLRNTSLFLPCSILERGVSSYPLWPTPANEVVHQESRPSNVKAGLFRDDFRDCQFSCAVLWAVFARHRIEDVHLLMDASEIDHGSKDTTDNLETHARCLGIMRRSCKLFLTRCAARFTLVVQIHAEGKRSAAATCLPSCTSMLYVAIAFGVSNTSNAVSVFRKNSSVSAGSASILFPHPTIRISGAGSTTCAATSASDVISSTVFTPHNNDSS